MLIDLKGKYTIQNVQMREQQKESMDEYKSFMNRVIRRQVQPSKDVSNVKQERGQGKILY